MDAGKKGTNTMHFRTMPSMFPCCAYTEE